MNKEELQSMYENIKSIAAGFGVGLLGLTVVGAAGYGINSACNNKTKEMHGVTIYSRAKCPFGHEEFMKFNDGKQELIEFSGAGLSYGRLTSYKDNNGDGIVDEIKQNASGLRGHKILSFLQAKYDYDTHAKEFDEANDKIKTASEKY